MSVETLVQEYAKLSKSDQARFIAMLSEVTEQNLPEWAHNATEAITEEEWQAMEQLRDDIRAGAVQTIPFEKAMSDLRK